MADGCSTTSYQKIPNKDPREEKTSTRCRTGNLLVFVSPSYMLFKLVFLLFLYTGRPLLKYYPLYYDYAFLCIQSEICFYPCFLAHFLKTKQTKNLWKHFRYPLGIKFSGHTRACLCVLVCMCAGFSRRFKKEEILQSVRLVIGRVSIMTCLIKIQLEQL